MQDESLTIQAAAELLQVEPATVEEWLDRGLRHTRDTEGTARIQRSDLNDFLSREGQGVARDAATET